MTLELLCRQRCSKVIFRTLKNYFASSQARSFACFKNLKTLKVGLYNSIPDIGDDHLQSYVNYIQRKWDDEQTGIKLTLFSGNRYDPYSNDLDNYLGTGEGSFDLIETDMARASELVGKVVEIQAGKGDNKIDVDRYLKATVDAVKHGDAYLGFPTLACGNFIIEIQQKGEDVNALDGTSYEKFVKTADEAVDGMVYDGPCGTVRPVTKHARLLGGKIDDAAGWYLPFIYLDAVIDVVGPDNIDTQINNVLDDNPHNDTVVKLRKFFGYFKDNCGQLDQKDVEKDVVDGQDAYFFGFSEKLGEILKDGNYENIRATGVLSPPFGKTNYALVYTDALVLNKAKFDSNGEDYQEAVLKFATFFTSDQIRHDFVMGEDLGIGNKRYLLPPIKEFYRTTSDSIYRAYYQILKTGISAPAISEEKRQRMESVLKSLVDI